MKSLKLFGSFSDPQFRHGGYAALVTAIVVALVIVVNILVDKIPVSIDLTRQKLFSLSEQSVKILQNLDQPVTIYGLFEAGKEPEFINEILQKYASTSRQVQVKYIDPFRNPGFLSKYQNSKYPPGENSIVVEMGEKFRVISQYDLFNYSAPSEENPFAARQAQSLKAEQKLTGAILYLRGEKTPVVYTLQGHMEEEVPYELQQQLEEENYTFNNLNLLSAGTVPEDADMLLVISPGQDLSDQEEQSIREFLLERGGKAFLMMDILSTDAELSNFQGILRSYGVKLERVLVIEEDPGFHLPQFQIGLIPDFEVHSITADLITNELAMLFPRSQAITELQTKRRSVIVQPFLKTSAKAWGKVDLNDPSLEPSTQDLKGPFNVAVAVTDRGEGESVESRIVVTASSFFLYPERGIGIPLKGPGNADLFFNAVSWLYGREGTISIRAKSLLEFPLRMNQLQFFLFAGISVIFVPLIALIGGLVIWLRRRHL
jgi:ABC-type uncharacterized transport system involved in gliding motility auxiliary subunit